MNLAGELPTFEPDFASPSDWATMYRACGLQVVPAHAPHPTKQWKRPQISEWKSIQEEIVPEATFDRWYGKNGEYARHENMGLLTGRCSSNVFVLDLDEYKTPAALTWWHSVLNEHNNGMEPETCQQVTGGGGRQLLFEAPANWPTPTNKTTIGVDVRGQGGFAVLPPSRHVSGQSYAWKEGSAPWDCEIAKAPEWLLSAVLELVAKHGGKDDRAPAASSEHTPSPLTQTNAFGAHVDGREERMRDIVWASVVDWYRECPLPPTKEAAEARMREAYASYERTTKSRLTGSEPNAIRLEKEGRGHTLFADKWRRAMSQWDTEIALEAAKPKPGQLPAVINETKVNPETGEPLPLIQTAAQFVDAFTPPEYLIDGIVQRGYLYSLTAKTGAGKTAVAMYAARCVALGEPFHGRVVKQGTVLFLAGENPDDIRARYIVLADTYKFDPRKAPIRFVDGVIDIAASMERIREEVKSIPDLVMVIVDTAAAYFKGDDGNNNVQQAEFARLLRQLSFLPGKPMVLVNCHPVKNAARDNLLPAGGGAFLNEVDGNLTLWSNVDKQSTLHWQGKFRGPEFDQMTFEMRTVESDKVINSAGELMPSVVAEPVSEAALERVEQSQEIEENRVLRALAGAPGASNAALASRCGLMLADGKPNKTKVQRLLTRLLSDKMVERYRGGKFRITAKGKKEVGIDDSDD